MAAPDNPFLVGEYRKPKYFCDRKDETDRLVEALEYKRNVLLSGPRRIGKTWLIHQAFESICRKVKNYNIKCVYVGLEHTHSIHSFLDQFVMAMFPALGIPSYEIFDKAKSVFSHVKPVEFGHPLTGKSTLRLNIESGYEEQTLKELFNYIEQSGYHVIVAFGEFQQLIQYPEHKAVTTLCSLIRSLTNVNFILASSEPHKMYSFCFDSSDSSNSLEPFFQTAVKIHLKPIDRDEYYNFSKKFFAKEGQRLSEDGFRYIYGLLMGHTWYMQMWLNRIYKVSKDQDINIREPHIVKGTLATLLQEQDENFRVLMRVLPKDEQKVLRGIARMKPMTITLDALDNGMLSEVEMDPETVQNSIKTLFAKGILIEEDGRYSFNNPFFALWIRYMR